MARPKKVGLEYFPLDCQMDDKILMLEAEHGMEGFGVYIRLLQYCYQMDDGKLDMSIVFRWKTLGKTLGILPENLRKMVDTMLEIDLFDRKIFDEHQKLTSNGIQKRISRVNHMRQKDRSRKAEVDSEQPKEFSNGKPPLSGWKSAQKESNTNVLPKGKSFKKDKSLAADAASEDLKYTLTHKIKLAVQKINPDYYWNGKDGKPALELIDKLRHSFKAAKQCDPTDEDIVESFNRLVRESYKLRDFYHFSDIPKFNENYNKVVTEIRNRSASATLAQPFKADSLPINELT